MKLLFWGAVILLIPAYLFLSFFFELSRAVGGYSGTLGVMSDLISAAGSFTALVGLAGLALGAYLFVRKRKAAKAFLCAAAGLAYALILLGGLLVLDGVHARQLDARISARLEAMYGAGWDAPSGRKDIPRQYEILLSQFYVITRDAWPEEAIAGTDLYAGSMPGYYGDSAAERIGFALMDLNGDGSDELLIGTAGGGETVIFAAYTDPQNPYAVLTSAEGEIYYLHGGEAGIYRVEIGGCAEDGSAITGTWLLQQGTPEDRFSAVCSEAQLDASGRMQIAMTPFSQFR